MAAGLKIVEIIADAFHPDWVCAKGLVPSSEPGKDRFRPWIAWTQVGDVPSRWLGDAGPPPEVRDAFGGKRRIWP